MKNRKIAVNMRPAARSRAQVAQCPHLPSGQGHFYWFKYNNEGVTGYTKCIGCGKKREG